MVWKTPATAAASITFKDVALDFDFLSEDSGEVYKIRTGAYYIHCSCPGYRWRGTCKHRNIVREWLHEQGVQFVVSQSYVDNIFGSR